jgi:catechol 2,3-dioxygenase-like lactoylglutathione lyase family enzyme
MEVRMSSADVSSESTTASPPPKPGEVKLEVVPVPVSDVDRAKDFYDGLGWKLDADLDLGEDLRVVQFTPPGSACSISFGKGLTTSEPGSAQRLELAVYDIDAAREDLVSRGVEVSELFHRDEKGLSPGPDPERRSYLTYASFSDPDGNGWLLQEIRERLPGR